MSFWLGFGGKETPYETLLFAKDKGRIDDKTREQSICKQPELNLMGPPEMEITNL